MLKLIQKYVSVGIINTALHWIVFSFFFYKLALSQAISNFIAFCIAVTFSFIINTKWTFNSKATFGKYISFIIFMGSLALLTGYFSDHLNLPAIITLISFSSISLVCGFLYSRYIVFKE